MLTRKNLHRSEELFFNSILSALLRLVLKFDFATLRNSEGATVTHLTIAPSKRHRSFAPSRINNA